LHWRIDAEQHDGIWPGGGGSGGPEDDGGGEDGEPQVPGLAPVPAPGVGVLRDRDPGPDQGAA